MVGDDGADEYEPFEEDTKEAAIDEVKGDVKEVDVFEEVAEAVRLRPSKADTFAEVGPLPSEGRGPVFLRGEVSRQSGERQSKPVFWRGQVFWLSPRFFGVSHQRLVRDAAPRRPRPGSDAAIATHPV